MSLTMTQKRALYDILEMPMFTTVNKLIDPDNLSVEQRISADTNRSAILQLEAHLTDLSDNYASLETELKRYLDRWDDLGTDQTRIEVGGVGSINGIVIDPDAERMRIRRAVLPIVPFYRKHEEMSLQASNNPQLNIMR